jgi:hypothetical protein
MTVAARCATATAAADSTIPVTTAIHSSRTKKAIVAIAARPSTQSGLVAASTRSPALKTGPFPWRSWSTTRRSMNPSSDIHRRCQAMTASTTTGTAQATNVSHRASSATVLAGSLAVALAIGGAHYGAT